MTATVIFHSETIIQVKVPLPFPLSWVNSYVLKGNNGITVIDPGLRTQAAEDCWRSAMREIGFDYMDIRQIVLTHHHPDHLGLAGRFQAESQAPVYLSAEGHELALRLWGGHRTMSEDLLELFLNHGMDKETSGKMEPHLDSFVPLVSPLPEVTFILPGEPFLLGDRMTTPILTPGHASGHLCFVDNERQEIFCGDHVLPQISPNVSYLPGSDPNPLDSFLTSLRQVAQIPVVKAYPGHREPFAGFSERCEELILHHRQRLHIMLELTKKPATAFAVCMAVFGAKLSVHQLRFAMSETLAHLVYLEAEGAVHVFTSGTGIMMFQKV